jgi:hypothetical protein
MRGRTFSNHPTTRYTDLSLGFDPVLVRTPKTHITQEYDDVLLPGLVVLAIQSRSLAGATRNLCGRMALDASHGALSRAQSRLFAR